MDWRKSSYSAENGNCAEAAATAEQVLVRDTNDRHGVTLATAEGVACLHHTARGSRGTVTPARANARRAGPARMSTSTSTSTRVP